MALQYVFQATSQFFQLKTSRMLLLQATIATIAITAFAPTNRSWSSIHSVHAQEVQPSVSHFQSISSNAVELEPTLEVDCLLAEEMGVRPEHCASGGHYEPLGLNPEVLEEVEQAIDTNSDAQQPNKPLVRIKLIQW